MDRPCEQSTVPADWADKDKPDQWASIDTCKLVGRVAPTVLVLEVLLAGHNIRASAVQCDAEGTGGLLSQSAATMSHHRMELEPKPR